ncbi:MAG: helix-turn-helix transcriptional regulator [Actinobacteria bacterium]|nr:helix-turn-helix transcriptional regulator [Actinomycetota bacterium]
MTTTPTTPSPAPRHPARGAGLDIACARGAQRLAFDRPVVPEAERSFLAAGVGAMLRERRRVVGRTWTWPGRWVPGMSLRAVAAEAGCSPSTLSRLERGWLRPRESLLFSLAAVLWPADPVGVTFVLSEAAGSSLRADSEASWRARTRRMHRVRLMRYEWAQQAKALEADSTVGLARAMDRLDLRVVDPGCRPGATATQVDRAAATLDRATALMAIAQRQRREAERLWLLVRRRPGQPPGPTWGT